MKIILTEAQFKRIILKEDSSPTINISSNGVRGIYIGPSQNPNDTTHRFINTIATIVGDELKKLYKKGQWTIVDLDGIKLETIIDKTLGNRIDKNTGQVEFKVDIPFIQVNNACDAYTSFDRRGGWGHGEGYKLDHLKDEVGHLPTKGTSLDISDMKKTPEGLVEYFAQWKNPNYQSHCGNNKIKKHSIKHNNDQETLKKGLKDLGIINLKSVYHDSNQVDVITDTTSPLVSMSYIWSNADELDEVFQTVKDANPNTPPKGPRRYDINGLPGYIIVFKQD